MRRYVVCLYFYDDFYDYLGVFLRIYQFFADNMLYLSVLFWYAVKSHLSVLWYMRLTLQVKKPGNS